MKSITVASVVLVLFSLGLSASEGLSDAVWGNDDIHGFLNNKWKQANNPTETAAAFAATLDGLDPTMELFLNRFVRPCKVPGPCELRSGLFGLQPGESAVFYGNQDKTYVQLYKGNVMKKLKRYERGKDYYWRGLWQGAAATTAILGSLSALIWWNTKK